MSEIDPEIVEQARMAGLSNGRCWSGIECTRPEWCRDPQNTCWRAYQATERKINENRRSV